MDNSPKLGQLITGDAQRDAVGQLGDHHRKTRETWRVLPLLMLMLIHFDL